MAQRIITNSLIGGEISPDLYGRTDLKSYFNGAASLENFIVRRTGGIRKRPGTSYLTQIDFTSPEEDTLDNKYKVFDYYFDAAGFGLLAFRLTATGILQTKFISSVAGSVTSTAWKVPDIDLEITAIADFDGLICKQVGDTLFFTRKGYHTFKCTIAFADLSTVFEQVQNSTTIPTPAAMTAVAEGFGSGTGYQAAVKTYALFGVKDGIISKPTTVVPTGDLTLPWAGGAKVTLTGTLDFKEYDYYIIGKKSGYNFGKISEIYPEESANELAPDSTTSDAVDRATVYGKNATFNTDSDLLFSGNPDKKSTDIPSLSLSPNCYAMMTSVFDTTWYRVATPHYKVSRSVAGATLFNLGFNQKVAKASDFSTVIARLDGAIADITPFYYTATTFVEGAKQENVTADVYGVFNLSVTLPDGPCYVGFIIEFNSALSENAKVTETVFMGMVFTYVQTPLITQAVESIPTGWATATPPSAEFLAKMAITKTLFGLYGTTMCTTLWNDRTVAGTIGNTALKFSIMYGTGTATLTTPTSPVYHPTAAWLSSLSFTIPADKTISSLTLHFGALIATQTGQVEWGDQTKSIVMSLYATVDADPDVLVRTWNVTPQFLMSKNLTLVYPDTMEHPTDFHIEFEEPVPIRGVDINEISSTFEFIDDNILPGAVTGIQEMLTVGDEEMDAGLVDIIQQRLVFSTSVKEPFTLWFSAVGDLYNWYANRPQADNDAFSVTLPATRASEIRHILCGKDMLLFTEDGVYACTSGNGDLFSYRTVTIRKICGAAAHPDVKPIEIDGKVIFIGEDGRTAYELKYSLMDDAIIPVDRSVTAYHLTESSPIIKAVYQRYPESVVWFLLEDGTLLSLTYMPDQEVQAWAHHAIATVSGKYKVVDIFAPGSNTSGAGIETTSDVVLVMETYSGTTLQPELVIEKMRPNVCADTIALATAKCIDHYGAGTSADETAVSSKFTTLRPESPEVSTQGIPKRVVDVCLRVRRSNKVSIKPYDATIAAIPLVSGAVAGGNITLATKDVKIMPKGLISDDGQLQFQSDDAYPCEILSIVYTMDYPESGR